MSTPAWIPKSEHPPRGSRWASGFLGLTLGSLMGLSTLPAQRAEFSRKWGVGVGGGVSVPLGAYSDTDNPGAHALMYFSYSLGPAIALGLDVGATRTPHKASGHSDLDEVLLGAAWRPGRRAASARPFLLASIGVVAVDADNESKGRFACAGGGGISIGRGDARIFVEARFMEIWASGGALSVVPVTFGFATRAP